MERLLNISRPEGFPLCAETLQVLSNNSEMLSEWLKGIPLKNRQAVLFRDAKYMVVCQSLRNRVVKVKTMATTDLSQCRVEFATATKSVHDSMTGEITGVWQEETASIVPETVPGARWTILSFAQVFETKLWYDWLPTFEAGLSGSSLSQGSFISPVALHDQGNILRGNTERTQMRFAVTYTLRAGLSTVLSIPMPAECPDGTRLEADLEVSGTGAHYPVRAYVNGGMLLVDIGRWLKDEGLFTSSRPTDWIQCNDIIRINKEVLL